jgi:pyruvate dehydrogenase E2 component (dihydrolipoamide acetyltransferase)
MAEFLMPSLGADMSAGTLMSWLRNPGDVVKRGDVIAVVHTDKADVDVEVFTSGVLERTLVEPGTKVPVGTPLALIAEEGAAASAERAAPPVPLAPRAAQAPAEHERLLISPSARELAHELGLDPASITGSGPHGRIQRNDVEHAAAARAPAPEAVPAPPPVPATPASAPTAPRPLVIPRPADERNAAMRRAISAAMSRSKREIPHFYLGHTIDMSRSIAWLTEENLHRPVSERLLHGVLTLKAVALALREVPELNATWQGDEVVRRDDINVGVAISLRGGGLVAPAIHHTDELSLDQLMHAFRDLVNRARSYSLRSSEMSDPTITVTSLGERGVDTMFAVIFPPQIAIVGFGTLAERLWITEDGQVLKCPVVNASLSADHRVTDGHAAAALLVAVDRLLQEPEEL